MWWTPPLLQRTYYTFADAADPEEEEEEEMAVGLTYPSLTQGQLYIIGVYPYFAFASLIRLYFPRFCFA